MATQAFSAKEIRKQAGREAVRRLFAWAQTKNFNQARLALLLGVSQSLVSRWKEGTRIPSLETIERITRLVEGKEMKDETGQSKARRELGGTGGRTGKSSIGV